MLSVQDCLQLVLSSWHSFTHSHSSTNCHLHILILFFTHSFYTHYLNGSTPSLSSFMQYNCTLALPLAIVQPSEGMPPSWSSGSKISEIICSSVLSLKSKRFPSWISKYSHWEITGGTSWSACTAYAGCKRRDSNMIMCWYTCERWFHFKCVGVTCDNHHYTRPLEMFRLQ